MSLSVTSYALAMPRSRTRATSSPGQTNISLLGPLSKDRFPAAITWPADGRGLHQLRAGIMEHLGIVAHDIDRFVQLRIIGGIVDRRVEIGISPFRIGSSAGSTFGFFSTGGAAG